MTANLSPCHAHIYYTAEERPRAGRLRDDFLDQAAKGEADILFVGQMTDRGVGPHPIPQYEVHFLERSCSKAVTNSAARRP